MCKNPHSNPCQALENGMHLGGMMPIAGSLTVSGMGLQIA